jgi:4-carboxymuconolactone decarboxylase
MMMMACNIIKAQHKMVLTNKQQCLVVIAAMEAKGDLVGLQKAVGDGLDNGLTVNEVKESLSQLYAYTGFPRSLNGLGVLQLVIKSRADRGQKTDEGRDATPLPDDYDALKQGTEVQTRLTGGTPFTYNFAPATDYYLKAHLFGDIFSRDVLTFAEREIVTVSAISALKGCEPQLKAHAAGALNMGVKKDELKDIPAVLAEKVGASEAYRASKAIAEVLGEDFKEGEPVDGQVFPKGDLNTAYARYFIGNSYLAGLANGGGKLPVANVTFEPGCRNNWHIHHKGGQILIVVGGRGWYQEWGKPARALRPGDVVDIPAEVKHWHGAAKDSWFQHIAIGVPAEGASAEWLEPVTDEEYNKLSETKQ